MAERCKDIIMKKYCLLIITCTVLLSNTIKAEESLGLGTEIKNELLGSMYSECMDNSTLVGIAKLGKISEQAFCSCFSEQVKKEFDKTNLEQQLNIGDITIKKFTDEIGDIGGNAGEYCADKLFKF